MHTKKFDYAILGQGAAAFAAAIRANELGKKTVLIGKNATTGTILGGTCINVGCVPSKRLISAGEFASDFRERNFSGIKFAEPHIEYGKIVAEKDKIVRQMQRSKYQEVLGSLENVTYVNEFGSFDGKGRINAGNEIIKAEKVLIATGARASVPDFNGIDSIDYLTNEEALSIKEVPSSLIVVGGRAMGLEFAQMFARLGTKVTLLQRNETILPGWEPELTHMLSNYIKEGGVILKTGVSIEEVGSEGKTKFVKALVEGKSETFTAENILFATGRKPNVEKLNLESAGIKTAKGGFVATNEKMETSTDGVYAAGDVTGEPMLETLAAKEGYAATENALNGAKTEIDKKVVPTVVFTMPEAAYVGLTDEEANALGIRCSCSTLKFSGLPKAEILGDDRGLVKMVIDHKSHRILGVSILSKSASELIGQATLMVKFGLTIDDVIDTVMPFPTLSEALKLTALSFYKDVDRLSCCSI